MPGIFLKAKGAISKGLNAAKNAKAAQEIKDKIAGEEASSKVATMPLKILIGISSLGCAIVTFFVVAFVLVIAYVLVNAFWWLGGGLNSNGSNSAAVGEAAQIEGEDARIEWLYDGNGVPQTESENNKYLETFDVEYLDGDGNIQTFSLTMHTKLKAEVQAVFQELIDIGFPIEWESGGGSIRGWNADTGYSGNFFRSAHCYGHAVDINVAANPCPQCGVGSESDYQPGVNEYSVTEEVVNIWKKHGFYWGGDWSSPKDYMHFSYFDH